MPGPKSPWAEYHGGTWKTHVPEFPSIPEITFAESADVAPLIDIVFGNVTGASKEQAIIDLVCNSIVDPPLPKEEFQALGLKEKLALFGEILNRSTKGKGAAFFGDSKPGPSPAPAAEESSPETPDGGSGGRVNVSAIVTRKTSERPSGQ